MGAPLFDCIDAVTMKNPNYKYNKKDVSAYILLMWLSHNESLFPFVEKLNKHLFNMPDDLVFAALYKGSPKGKRFIRWDKGVKDKDLASKKKKVIQCIMDDYGLSEFEAKTLFVRYIDV